MNESKQEKIATFLYAVVLTDEFFDEVYDVFSECFEEQDTDFSENEDAQELIETVQEAYEASLVDALGNFLDQHFTEQEIDGLLEEDDAVCDKFEALDAQFLKLIEDTTEQFAERVCAIAQDGHEKEQKKSCCDCN